MSDKGFISISDMMAHYHSGTPFSMVYVTYDTVKGKGGAVKQIDKAVKCFLPSGEEKKTKTTGKTNVSLKNPNHYQNGTINIRIVQNGSNDIRKVHVSLIRRYNGNIVK